MDALEVRLRLECSERSDRQPELGQEALLADAVLGDVQRVANRSNRSVACHDFGRRHRHVLELERDYVDRACELLDPIGIEIVGVDLTIRDLPGGRVLAGRERRDAVAQTASREREHPAELSTAQNAEPCARCDHCTHRARSVAVATASGVVRAESACSCAKAISSARKRSS